MKIDVTDTTRKLIENMTKEIRCLRIAVCDLSDKMAQSTVIANRLCDFNEKVYAQNLEDSKIISDRIQRVLKRDLKEDKKNE